MYNSPRDVGRFLATVIASVLLATCAFGQSSSFETLPSLPAPEQSTAEQNVPTLATRFDVSALPAGAFDADAGSSGATPDSDHHGVVKRAIRRTLEDQKELYRAPFKASNLKWDALVLLGTGGL
ncbi:MAG TPA: hypothetical protein VFA67_13740, partial [Candidatus Sulfotelmatobacter sp.]|nr:hypothetical protein [Candidatus Sulfotelmatobacter sp.]